MQSHPFMTLGMLLVLGSLTFSAFAQVEYVRDIEVPSDAPFIFSTSQAPFDLAGTSQFPLLFTEPAEFYIFSPEFGVFSDVRTLPPNIKFIRDSLLTWVGRSEGGPMLLAVTLNRTIITYDWNDLLTTSLPFISVELETLTSLAAQSLNGSLSLIGDNQHYTVNRLTGQMTDRPLAGVDTATTKFMSYGGDGLLYVLDYGNSRIASFDPDNAFAAIGSFTLETGVPTANQQFAIGINGSFYLADGSGGGSYYSKTGAYLGTFALPENAATASYTGQSFINTDAEGNIFVYDSAKGLHQYQDASVVPEPSTCALAIGTLLGALILRRRWNRARN